VESLKQQGTRAAFFTADAMCREDLRRVEAEVEQQLGVPSVLVNAAGGNDPKATVTADLPFEAIGLDAWRGTFDLNLVGGVLLPCQTFGPGFCARRRGTVINVASVSAHIPLSRVVSYSTAEQNRRLLFNEDGSPTARAQAILNHTPMARFGAAQELGGAVVFLASSRAAGFVTGTDLRVDGGFLSQTL
jgi:NAD(P)-dependent dehydrogenase (short-subunit alcohol dehydrogenase family)